MSASTRLALLLLLVCSRFSCSDGLQQRWIRKGRIKQCGYGSVDSIGESSSPDISSTFTDSAEASSGFTPADEVLYDDIQDWHDTEDVSPIFSSTLLAVSSSSSSNATTSPLSQQHQHSNTARSYKNPKYQDLFSRRQWLQTGVIVAGGALSAGVIALDASRRHDNSDPTKPIKHTGASQYNFWHPSNATYSALPKNKSLQRVNISEVVRQTNINLTMDCTTTCVSLDRYTFEKKATLKLPTWVPSFLMPPPRTIRKISDSEILVAALVAGSTVEMARTSLLYPLLTLKNRIQADIKTRVRTRMKRGKTKRLHPKRRAKILKLNAIRHLREGKLYAGLLPSLLVTVPATGVYYGIRDVARRSLNSFPVLGDIPVAVTAALIADVISLVIRTPADALAVRLQVATGKEQHVRDETEEEAEETVRQKVGNWFVESLERLPAVIITDLPYLLSRIALNRYLIHGNIDLAHYELTTIATALLCGFLTTPFDVARTRILIDSDDDPTNGIDGGSGMGLITTMRTIVKEGDGGIANLFAGWLERTVYLAIGRAWLEPLQILGYMALRDAILLEWFD